MACSEYETGKGMNATHTQDSFTMKSIDQRERTRGRNDILTRRLKNRERQRRYRARKRLEAELKNSSIIKPSTFEPPTLPKVEVQFNGTVGNYTSRVYCKRNWKKDARRAHASNDPEVTTNACAAPTLMSTSESQNMFLSGTTAEPIFDSETFSEVSVDQSNSEMHRPKLGRRDWKADARKKKN